MTTSQPTPGPAPNPGQPRIQWHPYSVNRRRGCVVWFTGLSGSGKSTIANAVDSQLAQRGIPSYLLDGDNVRHGLNAGPDRLADEYGERFAHRFGLTFAAEDRQENIRRTGCVAELFCSAGLITLTALVSPYRSDRDRVRRLVERASAAATGERAAREGVAGTTLPNPVRCFVEVFVDTPLEICEQRDPKGLYQLARAGKLRGMTGIDDPYEPPLQPEIVLAGGRRPVGELAAEVVDWLAAAGIIPDSSG